MSEEQERDLVGYGKASGEYLSIGPVVGVDFENEQGAYWGLACKSISCERWFAIGDNREEALQEIAGHLTGHRHRWPIGRVEEKFAEAGESLDVL